MAGADSAPALSYRPGSRAFGANTNAPGWRMATDLACASVRAPIFEEKVVDFLVELAGVTEKPVTKEELYKEDEASAA